MIVSCRVAYKEKANKRWNSMFHSTHFSPLTGEPDVKENYHTLTYRLDYKGNKTTVSLSQDNNDSEKAVEHSRDNWEKMLRNLKDVIERSGAKA